MNIQGAEGLNPQELNFELQRGGKLVRYYYCISLVAVSFRRTSQIHLIRAGENAAMKGMTYILVSVLLGWWGIPWGANLDDPVAVYQPKGRQGHHQRSTEACAAGRPGCQSGSGHQLR